MAKGKITDIAAEELSSFLEGTDLELYNSEFVKEGKDWFLRVYIDKESADEYVSTEDCEKVSRFLSDRLDELDPVKQNYYLEVSSPGLDRTLIKDSDFVKFSGRLVEAGLYKAVNGKKTIEGVLVGLSEGIIRIKDEDGGLWELPKEQVARTKLVVVF